MMNVPFFCEGVDSFVEKITWLASNKQLQKAMSLAARQRAVELDWRKSALKLEEIYNQL